MYIDDRRHISIQNRLKQFSDEKQIAKYNNIFDAAMNEFNEKEKQIPTIAESRKLMSRERQEYLKAKNEDIANGVKNNPKTQFMRMCLLRKSYLMRARKIIAFEDGINQELSIQCHCDK